MIRPELLEKLCCPESRQSLFLASPELLEQLNGRIREGKIKNHAGQAVAQRMDGALVREDRQRAYPIRQHLPILLVEEGLVLGG